VINVVLWLAGIALVALAAWRLRPPLTRMRELDQIAQNARRYESWRGGSRTAAGGDQTTGADIMRAMLRRQVYMWVGVGALGVVLVAAGFVIR
jgi:hypothetical protein